MGYNFISISEIKDFDFSKTSNTRENVVTSYDDLEFVVNGESFNQFDELGAKQYMKTNIHWIAPPFIDDI